MTMQYQPIQISVIFIFQERGQNNVALHTIETIKAGFLPNLSDKQPARGEARNCKKENKEPRIPEKIKQI